ncbi:hypothetical protein DFP72DRAFT_1068923 [Ephemerocybe angulata]|uniref:Uncharacterized protein n=1 Tax=Ephemerocybe angulata TaxID=980116 RepID=A0A8H6M6M5_9AGAR|nr:hypothetical protein DFP72DRAFT_1068923 [Tulosesus angulatus]
MGSSSSSLSPSPAPESARLPRRLTPSSPLPFANPALPVIANPLTPTPYNQHHHADKPHPVQDACLRFKPLQPASPYHPEASKTNNPLNPFSPASSPCAAAVHEVLTELDARGRGIEGEDGGGSAGWSSCAMRSEVWATDMTKALQARRPCRRTRPSIPDDVRRVHGPRRRMPPLAHSRRLFDVHGRKSLDATTTVWEVSGRWVRAQEGSSDDEGDR